MELWEAVKGRRSVRAYTEEPLDRPLLERLVEAAIWAPSGGNAQTWRFGIVTDRSRLRRLQTVSPGMLGAPPAVIVVCQDLASAERLGGELGVQTLTTMDSAMAAQNIMLAAHAEGLGTCAVGSFHARAVQRLLELPDWLQPVLLVSVGRPADTPSPPRRRTDVAFFEVFSATG